MGINSNHGLHLERFEKWFQTHLNQTLLMDFPCVGPTDSRNTRSPHTHFACEFCVIAWLLEFPLKIFRQSIILKESLYYPALNLFDPLLFPSPGLVAIEACNELLWINQVRHLQVWFSNKEKDTQRHQHQASRMSKSSWVACGSFIHPKKNWRVLWALCSCTRMPSNDSLNMRTLSQELWQAKTHCMSKKTLGPGFDNEQNLSKKHSSVPAPLVLLSACLLCRT